MTNKHWLTHIQHRLWRIKVIKHISSIHFCFHGQSNSSGLGQGLKNIGLPSAGNNMLNLASNPLLANAGTGLNANPLLSNTPFASPKVGLDANINGEVS